MIHPSLRSSAQIAIVLVVIGSLGWFAFRPRPTLDGLDGLLASGRFQAAETQLRDYLRSYPGDPSARVFLARVALRRPEPDPATALAQTEGVQPLNPRMAAAILAIRGDAYFHRQQFDRAEVAWRESLEIEPTIAEVGWSLLNLYGLQGRTDESRVLALKLYATEPDPHDRLQLLLQLIRFDAHFLEAGSVVFQLEPVAKANPADLRSALALGTAMVRSGRGPEGLDLLRETVRSHPDRAEPWVHLAQALAESGQPAELTEVMAKIPPAFQQAPEVHAARGWLAMQEQQWSAAADRYLEAFLARPTDPSIVYRLKTALHHAGRADEVARLTPRLQAAVELNDKLCLLYDRLDTAPDLAEGGPPDSLKPLGEGTPSELCGRVATVLRAVGRTAEADRWDEIARPGRVVGR